MIKVLVPVNFSDYSLNALKFGFNLAKKIPVEITVLHCFGLYEAKDELNIPGDKSDDLRKVLEKREEESNLKLRIIAQDELHSITDVQKGNITLKYRFEYGYPEDIIPKVSREENSDVIIMGTKTKGDTIKELLGSVTGDVIHKVLVPVLAVPANSSIDFSHIAKVLFLTEFDRSDYHSMHRLITIIAPFDTIIFAVHFSQNKESEEDVKKMVNFKEYCESTYINRNFLFHNLVGKDFVSSIENYVKDNNIGIFAMTRNKRTILQRIFNTGITRRLLFQTDIPLLVFQS